ncbi:hypothetical protein CK203_115128 [Vitis vinifera]|uniref:DAGKc domain-containing protein n=1 Tax=Vitis vinifera TaxID=29760 RepID=A0A438FEP2_VITVI|nr:hypothetical protein CK203_115128 [Vitis vinifera]
MSADILQFLKNKFMDELEEAEEEHPPAHDIPLHSYFLQIRELLETKSLTPSTGMKDCLYDLSIALTDCILFLEKRKMKINKDSSQGQGQGQGQGQSKATTLCLSCEIDDLYSFRDQVENIANLVVGRRDLDEKGFSKEIGIVGIGGCGKTLVARMVFDNSDDVDSYDCESRIWINLQAIQKGEVDFKKILKAMLKQCDGGQRDSVEVEEEELLEALCKALWSKSYLLVFDGIWISTWTGFPTKHPIVVKMKDEMIYHSHGLPLAATTFFTIMRNQTYGGDWDDIDELLDEHELVYYVMINPKDDANQRERFAPISSLVTFQRLFLNCHYITFKRLFGLRSDSEVLDRLRMVVFGGDATTNRVLRAVCDMELHPTPPIGLMPLGTQVNISISLGWGNQISDTDARLVVYLTKLRDAEEILIDR